MIFLEMFVAFAATMAFTFALKISKSKITIITSVSALKISFSINSFRLSFANFTRLFAYDKFFWFFDSF